MELSAHIDWISVTAKQKHMSVVGKDTMQHVIKTYLPDKIASQKWIEAKARNGYTVAMKNAQGVIVMANPNRLDMGTHFVYSGRTLANIANDGCKPTDVLTNHVSLENRVSRIDYAVDAKNSDLDIPSLAQQIRDDKHKSRARTAPYIHDGIRQGKTQYIGSLKNRTKLCRIYDKAIDLDLDQNWKRIELELHGQAAMDSINVVSQKNSDNEFADAIRALIVAYVDFPHDDAWREIMGSDEIWLSVPEIKQGNTELWLLTQVAPALAKILDLNEGFMHEFMIAVQENRTT